MASPLNVAFKFFIVKGSVINGGLSLNASVYMPYPGTHSLSEINAAQSAIALFGFATSMSHASFEIFQVTHTHK
jgi:hypothetical protein